MRCNLMKYQQIDNKNRTFSIRTLLDLKTFDSTKLLGDKQSQEPVKYLFKILEEIPTNTSSQQGIRYYIKFMKKYNDIFTTKNINAEDATKFLLKTISYWETILKNGGCSTQLVDMLRENYNSLYATEEITKIFYGQNLKKRGHLGTLEVENFFSIMRSKENRVDLLDYGENFSKATNEMIKTFAKDRPYTLPTKNLSKEKYDNADVEFTMDCAFNVSSHEKAKFLQELKEKNRGSDDQLKKTREFCDKYSPSKHELTIREATQKLNPTKKRGMFYCDHCVKVYLYKESLKNHISKKHSTNSTNSTTSSNVTQESISENNTFNGNEIPSFSSSSSSNENESKRKKSYTCRLCGKLKKGHVCTANSLFNQLIAKTNDLGLQVVQVSSL